MSTVRAIGVAQKTNCSVPGTDGGGSSTLKNNRDLSPRPGGEDFASLRLSHLCYQFAWGKC
jgi:hypothetical protein